MLIPGDWKRPPFYATQTGNAESFVANVAVGSNLVLCALIMTGDLREIWIPRV
ncbi:hypothetical protein [Nitrosospira sp. Nsp13]|uniref:hypothetical protein n=1 Tax=Nitrosospira sp. Nsp13 TaxID=1855332 RepID=UPI0015866CDA|nr:hypothetical protein [Nitrosospira sp. Nsp13]